MTDLPHRVLDAEDACNAEWIAEALGGTRDPAYQAKPDEEILRLLREAADQAGPRFNTDWYELGRIFPQPLVAELVQRWDETIGLTARRAAQLNQRDVAAHEEEMARIGKIDTAPLPISEETNRATAALRRTVRELLHYELPAESDHASPR